MSPRLSIARGAQRALKLLITLLVLLLIGVRAAAQSAASGSAAAQGSAAANAAANAAPTIAAPVNAAATVSGTVYDSLAGKPLAGALVQVVARGKIVRAWSAMTGANGEFTLPGVPRGQYLIGFLHTSLDSLGLGVPPRMLDVGDGEVVHVDLAVPSAPTIRKLLCTGAQAEDSTGMVLGFIRDADSGAPLEGATAFVMWNELVVDRGIHTERRQVPVKSNSEGWYALCGVPTDGPITARAELGKDVSGYIEIVVPPRGLLHRDFNIPRGSAAMAMTDSGGSSTGEPIRHGTARLTGVVRDNRGKTLAGAQLMVWGSGVTGSTGDDGTFSLTGLPAGTQALEARYVGYSPKRVTVDLVSGQTRSLAVTLDQRADVLGEVTVYGKPGTNRRDITGFLDRRQRGMGRFFTRADIERLRPFQFTDLMRTVPGIRVVPTSGFDYTILSTRGGGMSGGCQPQLYVDGVRLIDGNDLNTMVQPGDIAGIEVYAGASESPPQYTTGSCGSILIWTGPNLGAAKNK